MGGRSFHDVINHNAWLGEQLGTEYEILQFLVVEHTLLTLRSTVSLPGLTSWLLGDQGSCELALRRTGCS